MEDLVQQVFMGYFDCEVLYCGGSKDGGVDLFIIDSNKPILVQVKRRENPLYVEPVSLVRDLLGAMFIKNSQRGIFVSTANRFSSDAEKVKDDLFQRKKLDYLELINYQKFIDMLNLIKSNDDNVWDDLLSQYVDPNAEIINRIEYPFLRG